MQYIRLVHERTCDAVAEALSALRPARLGAGTGKSYLNACRNWPTPAGVLEAGGINEESCKTLTVLRVADLKDETIGLLVNYAMHGSFLCDSSFRSLGDEITGEISRFVERVGCNRFPVLWAAGGGGDQNLAVTARCEYCWVGENGEYGVRKEVLPPDAAKILMRRLAAVQGLDILNTAASIENYTNVFSLWGAQTVLDVPGRVPFGNLGFSAMPGEPLPEPTPLPAPLRLKLRLSVVGSVAFVGVNGEITRRHCERLRQMLNRLTVIFFDMSYGHCGCIPDPMCEAMNGCAAKRSFFSPAHRPHSSSMRISN